MSEGNPVTVVREGDEERNRYRIRKLKDVIIKTAEERDKHKAETEEARQKITALEQELADHPAAKRSKELEQQIRGIRHRKVFDEIARKAGVRPEGLDDLYNLSGYEPSGDLPDEDAVAALVEAQKTKRAYLFEIIDPNAPPVLTTKPGPASGQGPGARGSTTGFELPGNDDPRWSDVKWQWEHRAEIADAINHRLKNGVV